MKKIALLISILMLASTSVYALETRIKNLEPGVYTCTVPNQSAKCVIEHRKFGGTSYNNCKALYGADMTQLRRTGRCTVAPDRNKYYTCQYEKGSCSVVLSPNSGQFATCMGGISPDKAIQDARAGRCYKD